MTTKVATPYGLTDPITVNRGTIQGDSLSPFLFIAYLEPLLRWLTVGARGYIPGVLKQGHGDPTEYAFSNNTYADDLNVLTDSVPNMRTQALKVSLYADWGDLEVSEAKTSVTGIQYRANPQHPTDDVLLRKRFEGSTRMSNI